MSSWQQTAQKTARRAHRAKGGAAGRGGPRALGPPGRFLLLPLFSWSLLICLSFPVDRLFPHTEHRHFGTSQQRESIFSFIQQKGLCLVLYKSHTHSLDQILGKGEQHIVTGKACIIDMTFEPVTCSSRKVTGKLIRQ